jgi:multimeric flavodoxin WrbA
LEISITLRLPSRFKNPQVLFLKYLKRLLQSILMKVFGICASPRNNTTAYVLNNALDKLENDGFETEIFTCQAKSIKPCMHCDYCLEHKKCIIEDDMLEVYEGLQEADGLILATPVQSGGISSNLAAIMDRTRALEAIDYNLLRGKIGMSIAVGGDRTGGQDFAHLKNITYFMIHGIIPVSGGPFGSNLGASFWSNDSIEDIKEDDYGMESLDRTLHEFENFLNKYI